MKTIEQPYRGPKIREKKSIFIASVYPVHSREDVEYQLHKITEEMKKATHNAYAFRFVMGSGKILADCSDDGEVSNTAGEPILNILGHYEMVNILLVVTRFYGRIHLGPAGLIRQYSGAAKDLLDNIPLQEIKI